MKTESEQLKIPDLKMVFDQTIASQSPFSSHSRAFGHISQSSSVDEVVMDTYMLKAPEHLLNGLCG